MICDRCGKESLASTGSWFSTEQICMACSDEEKQHPDYERARAAEAAAVARGDYNFPGIGWTPLSEALQRQADEMNEVLRATGYPGEV